jgi:integrase
MWAVMKEGTWHSFRHSAIKALLLANFPLNVISAIAGHSSISVTVAMCGHVSQNGLSVEMQRGLNGYRSASA